MIETSHLRSALALGVSVAALVGVAPAMAQTSNNPATTPTSASAAPAQQVKPKGGQQGGGIQEVVVTAQRRSEAIQDVPVAVSAFSANTLKAQRLDGGNNLVLSIPNVNYSRSNFGGYNFQIRGVGEKVVTGGAEAGVSINENNLPLGANHFGDTDFYDVQQVEVLRGPQGTLYGRNATGGAVNVITAKPTDVPGGSITGEYGNYNTTKVTGFINMPLDDQWSARIAAFYLKRDGFGTNLETGDNVDGRDLYSVRGTLAWHPNERFRAYLMFEHYGENDSRNRVGKELCTKDPGPASLAGLPLSTTTSNLLSQGCQDASLYSPQAYGTTNYASTLGGIYAGELGLISGDPFANNPLQNHNLHDIQSAEDPRYKSQQNVAELNMSWDITDHLQLESITGYNHNSYFETADYVRSVPVGSFNATPTPGCYYCLGVGAAYPALYSALFPGGYVSDPQEGAANKPRTFDQNDGDSNELTQEIRLTSSFHGPLNFSVGVYGNSTIENTDYYVFFNPLTAIEQLADFPGSTSPYYIDPDQTPTGDQGHNYYDSRGTARLHSYAGFGEVYYQFTDALKLTLGIRQTEDSKYQNNYPIELAAPGGPGVPASTIAHLSQNYSATTGRVNLEWTPHLSFTNQTMVYATVSRGYKGGGFNTPCTAVAGASSCGYALTFAPEFITSYEVGTKNTLLDGHLVLNGDFFYYDYTGYQISTIVAKSSVNQNVNADIYGAELESIYSPIHNLTFNGNLGWLHTEITGGNVIDQANLTQGDANLTLVKASDGSNCVVNTQVLAAILAGVYASPGGNLPGVQDAAILGSGGASSGVCGGQSNYRAAGLYNYGGVNMNTVAVLQSDGTYSNVGQGVPVSLKGKQLPNSPDFTVSLGAQYVFDLPRDWQATLRGDYYWQDSSYARIFNGVNDDLKSWDNVNATLTFSNRPWKVDVQFYVKNAFNSQPITDVYLTDASSGLFSNTFTLDPRTYGISVTKRF
jgi:outer membrane receptor protein involved in Fe transport